MLKQIRMLCKSANVSVLENSCVEDVQELHEIV